ARWRHLLAPYYEEFGLEAKEMHSGTLRRPFDAGAMKILDAFRPRVVSFHFGLPESAFLERIRSWGGVVLSSATTVEEALYLEAHGADSIIAQGLEAGGHRGSFMSKAMETQTTLSTLLPDILAAVKVPVIAAGGIASRADVM